MDEFRTTKILNQENRCPGLVSGTEHIPNTSLKYYLSTNLFGRPFRMLSTYYGGGLKMPKTFDLNASGTTTKLKRSAGKLD
jgi:hypothetical protein